MMADDDSSVGTINFNQLLDEIETGSSGSLANVVRKLREHEVAAYHAGVGGPTGELIANFISSLDARASEHNTEIEKTCSHHYQRFVDSARELLGIQQGASNLEHELKALNEKLETAVTQFTDSCNKLSECKFTLEHIDDCIEALQTCLPVLEQYARIEQSIKDGRFYHALKTLEDLEHSQLQRIRSYAFSDVIMHRIPKTRTSIKNASLAELTDFLEQTRKNSIMLGAFAMSETAKTMGMNSEELFGNLFNSSAAMSLKSRRSTAIDSGNNQNATNRLENKKSTEINKGIADDLDSQLMLFDNIVHGSPANLNRHTNGVGGVGDGNDDSDGADAGDMGQSHIQQQSELALDTTKSLVDFGPVYRCLHIHSVLKERMEFERHYCAQRRKQCQLILSLSPVQQTTMREYDEFLASICGFFVVDDYLRHTLPGSTASYQTYLDELWVGTVNRLVEFARTNTLSCVNPDDLIKLKDYATVFEKTMENLGFPATGLLEVLNFIQQRYHQLLTEQWKSKFEKIINEDKYTFIKIHNKRELTEFLNQYPPADTAEFEALAYPKQLCYSWMVPRIYTAMRNYLDLCYRFCENMNFTQTEMEDIINRATNSLFTISLNMTLAGIIRQSSRDLYRLTQLCINIDELEAMCTHLDNYMQYLLKVKQLGSASSESGAKMNGLAVEGGKEEMLMHTRNGMLDSGISVVNNHGISPSRTNIQGALLLKDNRALVECLIYGHLNESVAQFIILSNYDDNGSPLDELTRGDKPSQNILGLTGWLKNTFELFANLPPKVAQTACFSVCKHIARLLYDVLFGSQVTSLSEYGLQQLSVDLYQCEIFARSQPVPGLDPTTLWLIFADLRQLLDLFHKDDWSTYINSRKKSGDGSPYDRVPPSVAIKLLERVREADKKRAGILGAMRKGERDRRKKLDDVIRQLKDINVAPSY